MEYKMHLFTKIGAGMVVEYKTMQKIFGDGPYQQPHKKITAKAEYPNVVINCPVTKK